MMACDALAAMRALPVRDLEAITRGGRALVLAPHADDESLGCGGLIAEACARGMPPLVAILTDGAGSHPHSISHPPPRLIRLREDETRQAVTELGLPSDRIIFLGLPDTQAPVSGLAFESTVAALTVLCAAHQCNTVLAPWRHDPHCDHEAAHVIVAEVTRRSGLRHVAYPVWGWTLPADTILAGPSPAGVRLDVTRHLAAKCRAIAAHRSQYAGVIEDDPDGFQFPVGFLEIFTQAHETYLTEP